MSECLYLGGYKMNEFEQEDKPEELEDEEQPKQPSSGWW